MKRLFDGASPPPRPPAGARPGADMVTCHIKDGLTLWLTKEEAGAAGYREVTARDGQRRVQFGMCRDDRGEWVYPPLKEPDETVEEMLERNREARRRMERCPTKRDQGTERAYR